MPELTTNSLAQSSNLQGYYRLESNLNDSSGNSRTLTGVNTVAYDSPAKFGNGYHQSNSKTNYLRINNAMNVNGGAITIGGWFKNVNTESSGDRGIVCQVNISSNVRYGIRRNGTNLVFSRDGVGGGGTPGSVSVDWSSHISSSEYVFLTISYDGVSVRGYVNGDQVGSAVAASGNGNGFAGAVSGFGVGIFQGWAGWDSTYAANGRYDDFFIFDRALTTTEINGIYVKGGGAWFLA